MAGKTLLSVGANYLLASTWKDGALSILQRYPDSPDGRAQFATFLQTHPEIVYLLTDFIEEDFHHETVPHLRGRERSALIARKYEQYYRNTPFRQAKLQYRHTEGRRDDEMLFSALTNPALVMPWLSTLLASNMPLAGIYSVSNISATIARVIPSSHLLLLSWEKNAGLRQTYFDEGHLRFSRLTPLNPNRTFSETVASETARTQQYLKSLSLQPPGQVLDVHIICHDQDRKALAQQLQNNVDMHYHYLDIQQLGQRFKAADRYPDSDATPLFLHLLAIDPPQTSYASAEHTHFFQLARLRRGLIAATLLLAAVSCLLTALNLFEGRGLISESVELEAQAERIARQAQQITQDFPNTLAPASDMKTAVLLLRRLAGYSPPPQAILGELSEALTAYPRIRVGKLSWQTSHAPETLPAGAPAVYPAQVLLLDGDMEGFSGDYRTTLDYLNNFQRALSEKGLMVTALSLPLDISPKGSIGMRPESDNEAAARFQLRIIWRPRE